MVHTKITCLGHILTFVDKQVKPFLLIIPLCMLIDTSNGTQGEQEKAMVAAS